MVFDLTARAIQVEMECTAGLLSIRGDGAQLQQVLFNLILNAIDAMSQTVVNARTLTLRLSRMENGLVMISVADTGCGIAPGDEQRIFEQYYSTKPQRLGLGLSLCRSIVLAHGGRMWAENRISGGAVLHFTVPEWKDDSR
jgi:signal transduction histidine kinase